MFCLYLIIYVMAFIPPDLIIITVEFHWVFSILYVRFFYSFKFVDTLFQVPTNLNLVKSTIILNNHFCKSLVVEINIII